MGEAAGGGGLCVAGVQAVRLIITIDNKKRYLVITPPYSSRALRLGKKNEE